jgi:hypothetical protein
MESLISYLYVENVYNNLISLNILEYKFSQSLGMYKINGTQSSRRMEDDRILKEIIAFKPKEKRSVERPFKKRHETIAGRIA